MDQPGTGKTNQSEVSSNLLGNRISGSAEQDIKSSVVHLDEIITMRDIVQCTCLALSLANY